VSGATRGSLVIAVLGTSLTARGAWVPALAGALEASTECPVHVLNFGKIGATSRWGLKAVDAVIEARPDITVVEFGINDAALHRRVSLGESTACVTAIIRALRAANPGARHYLMTTSPAIGLHRLVRPRLDRYYDLCPVLAAREGIGLIDNRPYWKALPRAELKRALPDGRHPTAEFAISITLANVVRSIASDLGSLRAQSVG
jgi:acyl-CoA thioesterase I